MRARIGLPAALLVVATLAGTGADGRTTARPAGDSVAHRAGKVVHRARLPVVDTHSITHEALEPTMGITPGGDIFVAAASFGGPGGFAQTEIMRSLDGGATWEKTSPRVLEEN